MSRHHKTSLGNAREDLTDRRRANLAFALAVALGLAGFAWLVITMQSLAHDLNTANSARDALARQVQQLGEKPVAGPPGSRGEPGQSVVGPRGPKGEQGEPGPTGPTGPGGKNGKDGTGTTGKPGSAGLSGAPGAAGTDGQPGAAGPQGEPGPVGPQGPQGPQGERGATGDTGPRGEQGPAPSGWTFTDPQGVSYECTPDSDGSTHYTCRSNQPAPEPSDQGPIPKAAGLDPQRRQYP